MDIEKYNNLNEFEWELELKQEDKNINSYITKLSSHLDLPNESEAIWKHFSHNSSMPGSTFWSNSSDLELDIDLDDDLFFDGVDQKTNSEIYLSLGNLASEFSRYLSTVSDAESIAIGVKILCLYGNTISKTLDVEELEKDEISALKKALVKRVVANINEIIVYLNILFKNKCIKNDIGVLENQAGKLLELREQILNIRFNLELS